VRATCYNSQSARRLQELQVMLDTLPQQPARPTPDDERQPAARR
jgi:hypothetical protein